MISKAIHLSELKVGVIINASSGGYDLECEHKMLDILKGAGIVEAKIWCGDADQIERSFTEATRRKLEVLIVLAGDGTIRTAAERCGAERSYLIPLPGGTMNMLARALYGDLSWEDALEKTLAAPYQKRFPEVASRTSSFLSPPLLARPRFGQKRANLYANEILVMLSKREPRRFEICLKPRCGI